VVWNLRELHAAIGATIRKEYSMLRTLSRQVVGLLIGAALASFAVAPAHAGTVNLTGISCTSLVVSGGGSAWTVACTSMTCSLAASNSNPAPGSSITLTATCDSGANSYTYSTTTGGCNTPVGSGTQATVSENAVRNCTYQVTGTNTSNNVQGQATTAVSWSTGTPAAPTGCAESANQTSFTAAGGTINLSASCATPASGIVWSWTRNGAGGWSAAQNPSETLAANGGSSAVTYTYQAKACNGSDSFGGANCTIITPQISASVAGSGGGGITCSGFSSTQVLDINWNSPAQVTTSGMGPTDAAVIRFTTGGASARPSTISGLTATGADYRAYLSTTACDFTPSLGFGAVGFGISPTVWFEVGLDAGRGDAILQPNTTYYYNVKVAPTTTCNNNACNGSFNLRPQ
jgi:hypothetical protein